MLLTGCMSMSLNYITHLPLAIKFLKARIKFYISFCSRQAIKPLSGSAPSVRAAGAGKTGTGDTTDGKQPSKSRQKKFQRHFPQVGPEEKVLNCKDQFNLAIYGLCLIQSKVLRTRSYRWTWWRILVAIN